MLVPPKFNYKRAGLIFVAAALFCFGMSYLLAERVSIKSTTMVSGHFKAVERHVAKGRGGESVSYNLFIKEQQDDIQVSADNSACFYYDTFFKEVKEGQIIRVYINKPFFFSLKTQQVVAVMSNNVYYLYFDCINDEIAKERIRMPLWCIVLFFLATLVIYKKEIKAHINSPK